MLVSKLQALLTDCYLIDVDADVADFLTTDRHVPRSILGDTQQLADEILLVQDAGEAADIALYLDPRILERLLETDPLSSLHEGNLNDFCKVLEGVSHFLYVAWSAGNDRRVTQLELEVQAEIDKYLGARLLLEAQRGGALANHDLLHDLFTAVIYHDRLSADQLALYRCANDVVRRYCSRLEQRYPQQRVSAPLMQELRAVYRMSQADMLSHINGVQFA